MIFDCCTFVNERFKRVRYRRTVPPTALPPGSDEDEDESRTPLTDRQPQYDKPSAVVKPSQLTEVVGISEEEFLYLTTYFMHGTSTGLLDQFFIQIHSQSHPVHTHSYNSEWKFRDSIDNTLILF